MFTYSIPNIKSTRDKKSPIIEILFHRFMMFNSLKLMVKTLPWRVKKGKFYFTFPVKKTRELLQVWGKNGLKDFFENRPLI
jgi:hypothetical protein